MNKNHNINIKINTVIFITILLFIILFLRLFNISIINFDTNYKAFIKTYSYTYNKVSSKRGNIYDRNNNILVTNKPIRSIYFKKPSKMKKSELINTAFLLANTLTVDYEGLKRESIVKYYMENEKEECMELLTIEEKEALTSRTLTNDEKDKLILSRITDEMLLKYKHIHEEIYIYDLMTTGFNNSYKLILHDVPINEYTYIYENKEKFKGVYPLIDYTREYVYDDTLKGIYGSVGPIDALNKDAYLSNGYSLDDIVGTSYLEKVYENYLKEDIGKYSYLNNGEVAVIKSPEALKNLVLTIDINMQKKIEDITVKNINIAKKQANTKYFDNLFVIVGNPNNGEIYSMVGKKIVNDNNGYSIVNYDYGIITQSITVGSSIKGASMYTAYNNNGAYVGEKRVDKCIKLSGVKEKCSWSNTLGILDDIAALKLSSNSYQFMNAINLSGHKYTYNMNIPNADDIINLYREEFKKFSLGEITGIDLDGELNGYMGNNLNGATLLDFSIGQFDNYTPIQLFAYINTIATGKRTTPHLLKEVRVNSNTIYEYEETKSMDSLNMEYINRIKQGFREVIKSGTGRSYVRSGLDAAGKTGTAQSFIDTNNDGKVDTMTYTKSFTMYYPSENPEYSIVVIAQNIGNKSDGEYISEITREITKEITNFMF